MENFDFPEVIIPHPDGGWHEYQTGGIGCTHHNLHGFVTTIKIRQLEDCSFGCSHISDRDEMGAEVRKKLAHAWQEVFNQANKNAFLLEHFDSINFDYERIDEMEEGWTPVLFEQGGKTFKAYLHNGNCD